ncbi:MAG TPA: hypothetical protein VNA57_02030 [Acidimicrobiales bacterium]|nr:hypothetical protein [Acidimicrobiales bacterium]
MAHKIQERVHDSRQSLAEAEPERGVGRFDLDHDGVLGQRTPVAHDGEGVVEVDVSADRLRQVGLNLVGRRRHSAEPVPPDGARRVEPTRDGADQHDLGRPQLL